RAGRASVRQARSVGRHEGTGRDGEGGRCRAEAKRRRASQRRHNAVQVSSLHCDHRRFPSMRRLLSLLIPLLSLAFPALPSEPRPATLTANGDGMVRATPDIAVVTVGVVTNDKTAAAALSANSTDMNRVIAAMKEAGIADQDIGTSGFYVNPLYPPEREQSKAQLVIGYRVTNELRVTVRDFAKAGPILDKVISAGAEQVNGVSFELSDRTGP